ncbi:MAG: DUF2891 domain-containing protein [Prevotellaceae bacterium]|jgi:hypothetical protein|nr:DUF2891 domain-containing protein [Prevotellaceae bacterium]
MKNYLLLATCLLLPLISHAQLYTQEAEGIFMLTREGAEHFAALALKCITQEFPNKTQHVQVDPNDFQQPAGYHPAFYGCFDWHSAVHGHWMLVKLLKEFPDMVQAAAIREVLGQHLTHDRIAIELAYFDQKYNKSFERTYGWAWLLKLAEELYTWNSPKGQSWYANLQPLAEHIAGLYMDFLPKQSFPNRTGVHPSTAFGLSFAWDYAITLNDEALKNSIGSKSIDYYAQDKDCPAQWEPGGTDFFSPCLLEAELMAKILPNEIFQGWLTAFLPRLKDRQPAILFSPVSVTDRSDGHLVHLDGLNLSRAWCFLNIAAAIKDTSLRQTLLAAAEQHLAKTIPQIADGDYMGEHWLASFAVYALFAGR